MKNWWILAIIVSFFAGSFMSGTSIFADPEDKGNPFDRLQKQIDDIVNGNTPVGEESKIMFLGTAEPGQFNSIRYACGGFSDSSKPLTGCSQNIPIDGKITNLTGSSMNAGAFVSPGIGNSYKLTVVVNGIETDLSCVIADDKTTCKNTLESIQVFAGDVIDLKLTTSENADFSAVAGSILLET